MDSTCSKPLPGYEDMNDADRLARGSATRWDQVKLTDDFLGQDNSEYRPGRRADRFECEVS
jgi:hypothetical protein